MFLDKDIIEGFAVKRNPTLGLSYLKENGELLSIAYHAGLLVDPHALDLYSDFHQKSFSILQCYPQYYRFILGLILDLESLGYRGEMGRKISKFVREQAFINFDTSDCRRLEVISLLSRNDDLDHTHKDWSVKILEHTFLFIQNSKQFTKFNKPLFYDLTHIVFFLTEHGHKNTPFNQQLISALTNIGILSLLDHDADLLSEVCICLKYLGTNAPKYWTDYLIAKRASVEIAYNQSIKSYLNSNVDEYHPYLVLNWHAATENLPVFTERFRSRVPNFVSEPMDKTPLSLLSDLNHECVVNNNKRSIIFTEFLSLLTERDQSHVTNTIRSSPQSQSLLLDTTNGNLEAII